MQNQQLELTDIISPPPPNRIGKDTTEHESQSVPQRLGHTAHREGRVLPATGREGVDDEADGSGETHCDGDPQTRAEEDDLRPGGGEAGRDGEDDEEEGPGHPEGLGADYVGYAAEEEEETPCTEGIDCRWPFPSRRQYLVLSCLGRGRGREEYQSMRPSGISRSLAMRGSAAIRMPEPIVLRKLMPAIVTMTATPRARETCIFCRRALPVAGGVVGGVALIGLIAALTFFIFRRKRNEVSRAPSSTDPSAYEPHRSPDGGAVMLDKYGSGQQYQQQQSYAYEPVRELDSRQAPVELAPENTYRHELPADG